MLNLTVKKMTRKTKQTIGFFIGAFIGVLIGSILGGELLEALEYDSTLIRNTITILASYAGGMFVKSKL